MRPTPDFEDLFVEECQRVMRTVFFVVQDQGRAEAVTQDAFVQLLRHWSTAGDYDRRGAWVRRVALRLAVISRQPNCAGCRPCAMPGGGGSPPRERTRRRNDSHESAIGRPTGYGEGDQSEMPRISLLCTAILNSPASSSTTMNASRASK